MTQLTLGSNTFTLAPTIGTCLDLQAKGIDLLGISGESELQKLVANPIDFLTALESLISNQTDDDEFQMPALASYMTGGKWPEARVAVLESFRAFFREDGYPQLAEALDAYDEAARQVTKSVTDSLQTGALKQAISKAVGEAIEELTTIDSSGKQLAGLV